MVEVLKEWSIWVVMGLWVFITAMHPHAASGALAGCAFYLAAPNTVTGWRRWALCFFSYVIGYGGGISFYGGPPPYNPKALLVAAAFSALAVVVFTALWHMANNNGDLPPWLHTLLKFISRKGSV